MIYPEFFPEDRLEEKAELQVFDQLKKVSDKYDVFYSRRFVTDGVGKKPEYEIDFIVSIPEVALVCIEVKGGVVQYNGPKDEWTQNGRVMTKRPDTQATSAAHSLANGYKDLIAGMPVGWALCFPDSQIQTPTDLPSSIAEEQLLDQLHLLHLDKSLPIYFEFLKQQFPSRNGVRKWMYENFKNKLLRGIGFVQVLSTKIKYDEKRFIELTDFQLALFNRVAKNKNIITKGPAGSGKTIVAKTIAQDLLNDGKKVLFMCFNRTLANKIRYEFDKYESLLEVTTFHSLARRIIEKFDAEWWDLNKGNKSEEFWNLDIPVKLEACMPFIHERYDALVIDEGQDFKEFWFELIFGLIKKEGQRLIFMDEMQNIFGHYSSIPQRDTFIDYTLPENCRNTKNIVDYLSEILKKEIKSFKKSPTGGEVIVKEFKNQLQQQKYVLDEIKSLTSEHEIDPSQILILLNSPKSDSCLGDTAKAGNMPIKSLDNKGRMQRDAITYTTINTFKGLEADVVFILDTQLIAEAQRVEKLYTEASRARFKLYVLQSNI